MYVVVDTYIHEIVRYKDVYMYETLFTLTGLDTFDWTRDVGGGEERPPPTLPRRQACKSCTSADLILRVFFVFWTLETCEFALYCTKCGDGIWVGGVME